MFPPLRLLLLLSLAGALPAAEVYKTGDTFAGFSTKDQHDKTYTWAGEARWVIVSFDMSTAKAANAFFERQPADYLPRREAIFISDIHGMPGIGRAFALPKMKKYPHRILLADAKGFVDRYPKQEDRITILQLDGQGTVQSIRFVDPKKEMAKLFPAGS